jgi:hypothetical protein
MEIEQFLARLPDHRRSGAGWVTRCPGHDDRHASLSIGYGDRGGILIHCHAGCTTEAVVAAMSLTMSDLSPNWNGSGTGTRKDLRIVETYLYEDERGELLFQVCRLEPKSFRQRRPDGKGSWIWSLDGVRRVLYRLPELKGRPAIFIPEGEKDVDRLWKLSLPATCNSGGAGKWTDDLTAQLKAADVERVCILPDRDAPGEKHARQVAESCIEAGLQVRILRLDGLSDKEDVSDWLDAGHSKDELLRLVKEAPLANLKALNAEDAIKVCSETTEETKYSATEVGVQIL